MKKKEIVEQKLELEKVEEPEKSVESAEETTPNLPEEVVVQPLSLTATKEEIIERVKQAATADELKSLEEVFSVAMTKNEMARMAKQDELLDLIIEQAGERIRKKPGELSTKDLLDYMNTLQNNLDRSHKNIKEPEGEPVSQINNVHNEVTVNMNSDGLSRDSQNKVMDVVKAILQQAQNTEVVEPTIDEETSEEKGVDDND